eukprot:Gb_18984 [translate_table: standard]
MIGIQSSLSLWMWQASKEPTQRAESLYDLDSTHSFHSMDDTDDDARYPPNAYALPYHHSYTVNPLHRPKLPLRTPNETAAFEEDDDDDEEDYEDEGESHPEAEQSDTRGKRIEKSGGKVGFDGFGVRTPSPNLFGTSKPSEFNLGRQEQKSCRDDWSENATLVLLDTWGEKFLQLGKKSLKLEQWFEVAKKVSAVSKTFKTDIQCRNRLDTLKKKYKREKQKQSALGSPASKWVYYKHMDALLNSSPWQIGLPCGVDAGEFVFLNPRIYLNQSKFDEVRDSPADSLSEEEEEEEDEDRRIPPLKKRKEDEDSFRVLADSINRFGEIYEKIENNKKQQMLDLEKIRMESDRDLEMQKRQILEQTKMELAKIGQGNDEIDASVTNMSG